MSNEYCITAKFENAEEFIEFYLQASTQKQALAQFKTVVFETGFDVQDIEVVGLVGIPQTNTNLSESLFTPRKLRVKE
jgi:hypothetical protein